MDHEIISKINSRIDISQFEGLLKQYMDKYDKKKSQELDDLSIEENALLPFIERICYASNQSKTYYNIIKNNVMSYEGITSRYLLRSENFKLSRSNILKITYVGMTLKVYLDLDPQEYPVGQFRHKNVSGVKKHQSTPFMVKVKSDLGLKRVLLLIEDLMHNKGLYKNPHYDHVDYVEANIKIIKKNRMQAGRN